MRNQALFSVTLICIFFITVPGKRLNAQDFGESAVPFYSGSSTRTSSASNEYRYGLVSLENTTNTTIRYEYKWGDENWQTNTIAPGNFYRHWWNYGAGSNSSPNFQMRYHNGERVVNYDLKRNRSKDKTVESSKKYYFKNAANYCNKVDLYSR